jgi:predicted nucleic acid-binding protein
MTFGDTGGWFAAYVPTDPDHWAASAWLTANQGKRLITTDYVVDELLTLLSLVPTLGVGMPIG